MHAVHAGSDFSEQQQVSAATDSDAAAVCKDGLTQHDQALSMNKQPCKLTVAGRAGAEAAVEAPAVPVDDPAPAAAAAAFPAAVFPAAVFPADAAPFPDAALVATAVTVAVAADELRVVRVDLRSGCCG